MAAKQQSISSGHKTLLIGLAVVALIGVGVLTVLWPRTSCEGILAQTAPKLEANLEVIRSKGAIAISHEKIQDLSESAQKVGLHLKACCSVLEGGKLKAEEFQQCIEKASAYDRQIALVALQVAEAAEAKEQGVTEVMQDKAASINQAIQIATSDAEKLAQQVAQISPPALKPKPKEGGDAPFAMGVLEFKWPGGDCWDIFRREKFVVYHCGTSQQTLQAGTYTIKPKHKAVFRPFEVSIKGASKIAIEKGGIFEFKWPGGDCWDIYRADQFVVYHCGTSTQALEAGKYIVKPKHNPVFEPFQVNVTKGATTSVP